MLFNPDRYVDPEGGCLMPYAAVLHLHGKDRREEFEARAIFLLTDFSERENREMERSKLEIAFRDFGEPVVLTTRMPITWSDEAGREYEVFLKGQLETGSLANLMKHVEYIGKKIIYHNEL